MAASGGEDCSEAAACTGVRERFGGVGAGLAEASWGDAEMGGLGFAFLFAAFASGGAGRFAVLAGEEALLDDCEG